MSYFNNALNTFLIWLYSIRHMVKDYSYSEGRNPLSPLHGLLFPISSKGSFICITALHIPQPLLHQLWSTGWKIEIAQWVQHEGVI